MKKKPNGDINLSVQARSRLFCLLLLKLRSSRNVSLHTWNRKYGRFWQVCWWYYDGLLCSTGSKITERL